MTNDTAGTEKDSASKETAKNDARPYPWIIGPVIDYLFVAGGAVWIMILANQILVGTEMPFDKHNPRHMILFTIICAAQHAFLGAHNVATYFRLWGAQDDRERYKFYRAGLLYAAVAIIVLGIIMPELGGVLIFLYLAVSYWHFAMQAFGIALVYCAKRNYTLGGWERTSFRTLILALSAFVIVRLFTDPEFTPYNFYGAATPFWVPVEPALARSILLNSTLLLVGLCVPFCLVVCRKIVMERRMLPAPVILMLATILALGLTNKPVNSLLWLYVPALFHASQYLAVSLMYHLREQKLPEETDAREIAKQVRDWPAINYLGKAVLIGCSIYIVLPHIISLVGLAGYDQAIGLVFVVVNYHQMLTDAAIWRLRDERVRKLLI